MAIMYHSSKDQKEKKAYLSKNAVRRIIRNNNIENEKRILAIATLENNKLKNLKEDKRQVEQKLRDYQLVLGGSIGVNILLSILWCFSNYA